MTTTGEGRKIITAACEQVADPIWYALTSRLGRGTQLEKGTHWRRVPGFCRVVMDAPAFHESLLTLLCQGMVLGYPIMVRLGLGPHIPFTDGAGMYFS